MDPRWPPTGTWSHRPDGRRSGPAIAADADQRRQLLASVTELAHAREPARPAGPAAGRPALAADAMQEDFTGQQRSALAIVPSGAPAGEAPAGPAILRDDGT
ncbi:MAG: hypothetical protein IPJ04_17995, partial [Candidatus Eisenbacteria bacterium]|nr:hypothetical protein [Candidatus Eisenbacteria bacterium]